MPTVDVLRRAVVEARAEAQAALHDVGRHWTHRPRSSGGSEPWTPRQIAVHLIRSEVYFASNIAHARGAPVPEQIEIDSSTAGAAASALTHAAAVADDTLHEVHDDDLGRGYEAQSPDGVSLGMFTVAQMMQGWAAHTIEHVQQLRGVAGEAAAPRS